MSGLILGLSAFRHDSAAVLVRDGAIESAAQEERFTRRKFEAGFPTNALRWCLGAADAGLGDVGRIAVFGEADDTAGTLVGHLRRALAEAAGIAEAGVPSLAFVDRHRGFAAAAYLPGPCERAAVLCLDGGDRGTTTTAWLGDGARLVPLWQIQAPHSLGLLYSAATGYCGFRVRSGEYKLMGLAPYGEPRFAALIRERLIAVAADGSFRLAPEYFDLASPTLTSPLFHAAFGGPPRKAEEPLGQRHLDIARSVQAVLEDVVLRLARALHAATGAQSLCMAGGVALNCVANGRLLRDGPFEDVWVQPAAGDAGGALGAALAVTHGEGAVPRRCSPGRDAMQGTLLGPSYTDAGIEAALAAAGAVWQRLDDERLFPTAARLLADGSVLGWLQGRMEFGPRALGARSILADPRHPGMQSLLNRKVKLRETFRPFAPAVLVERAAEWFTCDRPSPYMLFTHPVRTTVRLPLTAEEAQLQGLDRLFARRSRLPAVTHVDYSARLQTVDADRHPRFARLLAAFADLTGCPVLVNTSFNVRGEPIVCSPADAYACFMRTDIDALVVGNALMMKADQPARTGGADASFPAD